MTDWDGVYSYIIAATQWTWEYVDEFLTLPRLNALQKHWRRFPPVHMSVAAFVGIKPPEEEKPKKIEATWQRETVLDDERFNEMMSRYKPGVRRVDIALPR